MEVANKIQIKSALRKSFGDVLYVIHRMDESQFQTPIAEGKWSPYEIVGHLWLSGKGVPKAMGIPKEILNSKFGNLDRTEWSYEECKKIYFKKLKTGVIAPSQFVFSPKIEMDKESLSTKLKEVLDDLQEAIDNWSESDLSTYTLPHPAIGLLSMREMLFSTDFHTIHHCDQMSSLVS